MTILQNLLAKQLLLRIRFSSLLKKFCYKGCRVKQILSWFFPAASDLAFLGAGTWYGLSDVIRTSLQVPFAWLVLVVGYMVGLPLDMAWCLGCFLVILLTRPSIVRKDYDYIMAKMPRVFFAASFLGCAFLVMRFISVWFSEHMHTLGRFLCVIMGITTHASLPLVTTLCSPLIFLAIAWIFDAPSWTSLLRDGQIVWRCSLPWYGLMVVMTAVLQAAFTVYASSSGMFLIVTGVCAGILSVVWLVAMMSCYTIIVHRALERSYDGGSGRVEA